MDIILYGGIIYTSDPISPIAEAIGIKGRLITHIGSNQELMEFKKEETVLIDLHGRTVLPGFNDSHLHLLSYGLSKNTVDLNDCKTIQDVIHRGQAYIEKNKLSEGHWVEGRGWDQNMFVEKRMLSKNDLDQISSEHPIMLKRTCGQITVVNSMALRIILGVIKDDHILKSEDIEKDHEGNLTGLFRGVQQELVYDILPRLSQKEIETAIIAAADDYVKMGLTSVQTNDFELKKAHYTDILKAYEALDREGRLPIRINLMICLPEREELENLIRSGYRTGTGTPILRIGPYTLQTDGSLGARTAALSEPYFDDQQQYGVLYYDEEEFYTLMELAWINGFQVAADGIGDRGMKLALETFADLNKIYPKEDPRFCVDHCQITTPDIFDLFLSTGAIAGLEVGFVSSDLHMIEKRVGLDRAKWTYNWKRFIDNGIPVAFGSDSPVEDYNPLRGIHAAVNRQNENGFPLEGWLPDQKLKISEAIAGFTTGAAYATFEDKVKGHIGPGTFADLVVLDRDIMHIELADITQIRVMMTIMDGVIRFQQ
jgi:hypothetical protein